MSSSQTTAKTQEMIEQITQFVETHGNYEFKSSDSGIITLTQNVDGKAIKFEGRQITEIINRVDVESKTFLQINFANGQKVLITENLVGFRPFQVMGLNQQEIPKVVTTSDLVSVLDAIQEQLGQDEVNEVELDVLKKVFQSILFGGEISGFDLAFEKKWLQCLVHKQLRASA